MSCPSHSSPRFRLRTRGTCNFPIPFLVSHRLILLRKRSYISHAQVCCMAMGLPAGQYQGELQISAQPKGTFRADVLWVWNGPGCSVKCGHPALTQGQCHCASESPGSFPTTWMTGLTPRSHFQFSLGGTRHQRLWKTLPRILMGSEVWEPLG